MKEKTTLEQILNEFVEDERKSLVKQINRNLKAVDCEDIQWMKFEVFDASKIIVKNMLKEQSLVYIMITAMNVKDNSTSRNVKISVNQGRKREIWTVNCNGDEIIALITIPRKEYLRLLENN